MSLWLIIDCLFGLIYTRVCCYCCGCLPVCCLFGCCFVFVVYCYSVLFLVGFGVLIDWF